MKRIVIVGGGYAGFYTAWKLEKRLRRGEARVTIVDHAPYMTYQPFLPEVAAGSIEPRHVVVPLRRHLRRTTIVTGQVINIEHADRSVRVLLADDREVRLPYDEVVVTAGVVTRLLAIPGLPETAIGLKRVEESVAIRDAVLTAFDRASCLPVGPTRSRLLTFTFVGGGFSGVEGFGEVQSLAGALTKYYPGVSADELAFHLVEATDHLLPEMGPKARAWTQRLLERRGATVHLETTVISAVDSRITLSSGESFESGLVVWAAGNARNPIIAKHTDLPVNNRGVVVRADLRVGTPDHPVEHAWAAGDDAAVPDLAAGDGTYTTANAQHAVRQGKHLAKNLLAVLRGREPTPYRHHDLGVVATLGIGTGIFQSGPVVITGLAAWMMHRGYHVLAVPTWERKTRVALGWLGALVLGRDIASLESVQHPRFAFQHHGQAWRAGRDLSGAAGVPPTGRGAEAGSAS